MSFFVTVLRRDVVKSLKADNICSEQLGRYSSAMFWEQICVRLMCRLKLIYVIDQGESWAAFLNETFMLKKNENKKFFGPVDSFDCSLYLQFQSHLG